MVHQINLQFKCRLFGKFSANTMKRIKRYVCRKTFKTLEKCKEISGKSGSGLDIPMDLKIMVSANISLDLARRGLGFGNILFLYPGQYQES